MILEKFKRVSNNQALMSRVLSQTNRMCSIVQRAILLGVNYRSDYIDTA